MSARVRLVGLTVTPTVVLDDGEHLTPQNVGSMNIPGARLDELPTLLRDALGELQGRLDAAEDEEGG